MTDPTEIARVAAGLTRAEVDLIVLVASVLDAQAGDGLGTTVNGQTVWIDDLVLQLAEAFGIEWDADFGEAVRDHILREKSGG